ncbi:MAG: elongation factor G [Devosia sp.]|nr:elongation factor G [Devosia sp.]
MDMQNGRVGGPRCIALVGPFGSGKTTLLEAILARTGAISRQGRMADGNTLGDASAEARANAMSVEANIAETAFMGDRYTFIDCPGSVEFQYESAPILSGADLAVVVAEADPKKLPALQVILRDLEARGMPHMLFLNKVDKLSGRVRELLATLQPASASRLILRQIPLRANGEITGFIDLALERAFNYHEGAASDPIPIPEEEHARELEARAAMLEQIADFDDTLLEQLLEDIAPGNDLVFADLRREMQQGLICPVFIGSAEHGYGVGRLLKALRHEAPTIAETNARLGLPDDAPTCVQVMKTIHTAHGGKLSVVRVLAGEVADSAILLSAGGTESKVSGVFRLMGSEPVKRDKAVAGETVALGKLDEAKTGDTLYLQGARAAGANGGLRYLAPLRPVEPVMALAVAPRERKDDVRLSSALAKIIEEDPSLHLHHVQETGETVLEGSGEMHLRVTLERLTGKYGIAVLTSTPRIAYRETIRKPVTKRGRHKKQSGGHGQFGDVVLDIKPLARGEGLSFSETITGGVVPRQYFSSVETGVLDYLNTAGPLGFPVVDVAVTLTDGSYHTVDSSDQAFKSAAQTAMREGMPEAAPVLLEPIMEVTVYCPSEANARINAILSRRRGQILGSDSREGWPGWDEVRAQMPAAEIQDLIVELRSATAGVGSFVQKFDHFSELTGRLADEVTSKFGKQAA